MTNWMTEQEYADHLGVSFRKVVDLIISKTLPCYRIGSNLRIDADEADDVIKATMRCATLAETNQSTTP
jgi:DNA binding domain, excisionase family